MTNLQQAYLDLLPFSDCTTVTLRAATGQEGGETGVEGHEEKGHLLFLDPLGQLQGLSACPVYGNSTFF